MRPAITPERKPAQNSILLAPAHTHTCNHQAGFELRTKLYVVLRTCQLQTRMLWRPDSHFFCTIPPCSSQFWRVALSALYKHQVVQLFVVCPMLRRKVFVQHNIWFGKALCCPLLFKGFTFTVRLAVIVHVYILWCLILQNRTTLNA